MDSITFYLSAFLLVLFCTAFVKLITTLSIFRYGLGLNSAPFGLVVFGLAIILSIFLAEPAIKELGGFEALAKIDQKQVEKVFSPFLEKNIEPEVASRLIKFQTSEVASGLSFYGKLSGYMLSQLKQAFVLGFAVLIPFLIIDFLVLSMLGALNVSQISAQVVSLPIKLLLFFALDGWLLLTEKMLGGYNV